MTTTFKNGLTVSGPVFVDAPSVAGHAARKADVDAAIVTANAYTDTLAQGLDVKKSVRAATTAALATSTYANGTAGVGATLTSTTNVALAAQDSLTLIQGERLLVKNQAAALQNGIYEVTQVGSGALPFILTRSADMDNNTSITPGSFVFVEGGATQADTGWVMSSDGSIVIGTTSLNFTQFSSAGVVTAGNGLTKVASVISALSDPGSNTITAAVGGLSVTAGSIANSHIAAGAGIVYSKLVLTGNILNADIAAGAAIVDTKLATITSAGKVSDSALSSNVVLENATNLFTVNQLITLASTQLDFGAAADQATLTGSATFANMALFADYNGTTWTARSTGSAAMNIGATSITFTVNSGLTSGNSFTPTVVATINATGFLGNGSQLTALAAGNLTTGTVPLARITGLTNTEIAAGAAIVDTKLATISTALKVSNSATTATAINTNSAIVARDGAGSFAATMITLSGTTTASTDVATKAYVDAAVTGFDAKDSVRAATTANITLSAPQTIDGVSVIAGDRVLVKNQTTASQNGIYDVAAGAWVRSSDADNTPAGEVTAGMFTFVSEGTTQADTGWILTTNDAIVLGTTSLAFTQFSAAGTYVDGLGLALTGNSFSVNVVANRTVITGDAVDVAPALLPSPGAPDANKYLMATGANTAAWTAIATSADGTTGVFSGTDHTRFTQLTTAVPRPTAPDSGKRLQATGADTAAWTTIPVATGSVQGELTAADFTRFDAASPSVISTGSLADNTAAAAVVNAALHYTPATANGAAFDIVMKRGTNTNVFMGRIFIANTDDGSGISISTQGEELGAMGVTFTADLNTGNIRLLFTSTSTGAAASYRIHRTLMKA